MDDKTREELAASFRRELEDEHDKRLVEFERKRERARHHARRRQAASSEEELSEFKEQLREEFYKEKGYMLYVDSTGREKWLPEDEYHWRMKARRRHAARHGGRVNLLHLRESARSVAMYAAVVLFAILVGLFLIR